MEDVLSVAILLLLVDWIAFMLFTGGNAGDWLAGLTAAGVSAALFGSLVAGSYEGWFGEIGFAITGVVVGLICLRLVYGRHESMM